MDGRFNTKPEWIAPANLLGNFDQTAKVYLYHYTVFNTFERNEKEICN
jgi:hypothetical protein